MQCEKMKEQMLKAPIDSVYLIDHRPLSILMLEE